VSEVKGLGVPAGTVVVGSVTTFMVEHASCPVAVVPVGGCE
jgi:nucleotide-binding universal stress UspA family protein